MVTPNRDLSRHIGVNSMLRTIAGLICDAMEEDYWMEDSALMADEMEEESDVVMG